MKIALEQVAREHGQDLNVLALLEKAPGTSRYRTFNNNKLIYSLAMLKTLMRADLLVFDHVQIAAPLLFIPKIFWPKVIIFAHGSEAGKRVRRLSIKLIKKAGLVLTNSDFTLNNMNRYFSGFNGKVCHLGLPPNHKMTSSAKLPIAEEIYLTAVDGSVKKLGDRVMLMVARMNAREREKGHRELIEVMARLVEKFPDAQLVFAGSGSDETELKTIAAESVASSNIFFCGKVENEELESLYSKCYAYVMPSRQEGFGLVYLEAMNYAKPCVACRDDGAAEVVVDGVTGRLVDQPIDLDELRYVLEEILKDEANAKRMGGAGRKRLNEKFSSAAHQERIAKHVRNLLQ
ncbi:glycosyltransferase family 4 protein [Pseudomonadota bacterium]